VNAPGTFGPGQGLGGLVGSDRFSPSPIRRWLFTLLLCAPALCSAQHQTPSILLGHGPAATPLPHHLNETLGSPTGPRWRAITALLSSTGGYVALGLAGGGFGYHLDDSAGCDDFCLPEGVWVGWTIGSAVGAGLGAHLGGGGSGSLAWTLVGAGAAQSALGLYGASIDNPFVALIPVSVLAALVADGVSASR